MKLSYGPKVLIARAFLFTIAAGTLFSQPKCPLCHDASDSAKPNSIHQSFQAADDATFPNYAPNVSPAKKFDITQLPSYTASTTDWHKVHDLIAAQNKGLPPPQDIS